MPFEIVRNDITKMQVDAIVNAASRHPRFDAGVDAAIHKAAGPRLLQARKEIGYIAPGSAAITPAFDLESRYVIHAVSPLWRAGLLGEAATLRRTYDTCLRLALENGCRSIAFPLLASGNNGFPKAKALQIAVGAFSDFLLEQEMQIYLVVFGKESVQLSEKLVSSVRSYIDENYVATYEEAHPDFAPRFNRRDEFMPVDVAPGKAFAEEAPCFEAPTCAKAPRLEAPPRPAAKRAVTPPMPLPSFRPSPPAPAPKAAMSLGDYLKGKDAGFTETLLDLIQKKGLKNSTVYKKANISKQHFSKLINDPYAKPSKATAIALALALELDLNSLKDLIGRAGFALTTSSTFDLIIQYFIEHKQYNVIEINIALYEFDQPLLGG